MKRREYYTTNLVSLTKDGVVQTLGKYIVTPAKTDGYREILTDKRIGYISTEETPELEDGTQLYDATNVKNGIDFSLIFVDKGSLELIPRESLKDNLEKYNELDKNSILAFFYKTIILNGEIPIGENFYQTRILGFNKGFRKANNREELENYVRKSLKCIVFKCEKGKYTELLSGYTFGHVNTMYKNDLSSMLFEDDWKLPEGLNFYATKNNPNMYTEADELRTISNKFLHDIVDYYCNVTYPNAEALKSIFDEENNEIAKSMVFGPKTSKNE